MQVEELEKRASENNPKVAKRLKQQTHEFSCHTIGNFVWDVLKFGET